MKNKKVYPNKWQTVPFTFDLFAGWSDNGRPTKELILKNDVATRFKISEMTLNIDRFTAVDSDGNEYPIMEFPKENAVTFKGMGSGHFKRLGKLISLPIGNYESLRFYVNNNGNTITYRDGEMATANQVGHLDFNIENGLQIEENEATEMKLWFDFAPFQWNRRLKPFMDLFANKNQKPRLVNSFGN